VKQMDEVVLKCLSDLKSSLAGVRSRAAWQLGQLRDRSAVPALIEALQDENEDVRWSAAWALGELGDEAAIPALEATSQNDESDDVRGRAWESLRLLRGETGHSRGI